MSDTLASDRGTSTALGYVLTITITAALVSGLLVAGGDVVGDQREQTVRSELQVVGQRFAAELSAADRLARTAGSSGEVVLTRRLPARVTGVHYRMTVETDANGLHVDLSTEDPDVSVRVDISVRTDVNAPTSFSGGDVVITYDAAADQLEVSGG